jgi:signal peptidase I
VSDTAPFISIREQGALELIQSLLRQGISVRIRVSGDSMLPLLKGGEVVEVAPLTKTIPKLGDILFLCDQPGNPLVHRLIWRRNRNNSLLLLTKGDACPAFDGFIPAEKVLGRVQRFFAADAKGKAIDLHTPMRRLQAAMIVSRALIGHTLRKTAPQLWQ